MERRAVAADRRRHEGTRPIHVRRMKVVARLPRQTDAPPEHSGCLGWIQTATGQTGKGRLVAGAGDDVGAGTQVVVVHASNQSRVVEKELGGPQRVTQIGAVALELRGQTAVE